MAFMDYVQTAVSKIVPEKKHSMSIPVSTTGGIGSGGALPFDDDMIVSKPAIIFYISQIFFNFLAMACFASVASFQAKWGVGPSGLSGFAIFVSVAGIFYSVFLLFVPVVYEKYDKGARLARALKEVRVSFILSGTGVAMSLLIAFITTISAWTEAGCKNADNDPNADKGDDFKKGLSGWCSTKKAGAVFFWLAFVFWAATLVLAILDFRRGKNTRPRDPPFTHPDDPEELGPVDDDESTYESSYKPLSAPSSNPADASQSPFADTNRYSSALSAAPTYAQPPSTSTYSLPRPSIDAYGAFSDPAPTGFAPSGFNAPENDAPRVSRTMQYADPYAAVRATVSAAASQPAAPAYEPYGGAGYR